MVWRGRLAVGRMGGGLTERQGARERGSKGASRRVSESADGPSPVPKSEGTGGTRKGAKEQKQLQIPRRSPGRDLAQDDSAEVGVRAIPPKRSLDGAPIFRAW